MENCKRILVKKNIVYNSYTIFLENVIWVFVFHY